MKNFAHIARLLHWATEEGRRFCDCGRPSPKHQSWPSPIPRDPSSCGDQGREKVVSYYSQTLSKAKRNYCWLQSQVFGEVCRRQWIHKTCTTPLHPQSNGLVEHFNRTLATRLVIVTSDFVNLPLSLERHISSECTPCYLKILVSANSYFPHL